MYRLPRLSPAPPTDFADDAEIAIDGLASNDSTCCGKKDFAIISCRQTTRSGGLKAVCNQGTGIELKPAL